MKKEKLRDSLTSKEDPLSSHLVKNTKEVRGRDVIDVEGQEFFSQLVKDIEDLKKTDASLHILLHSKMVNLDETISSAREKISKRMEELEELLPALKGKGFIRDPKIKYGDIDEEFQQLMAEDKDKIEIELEYLETTYRTLGHLLRAGIVSESDAFVKAVEAVSLQIKKFTP